MKIIVTLVMVGFVLAGCSSSNTTYADRTPVTGVCKSCKPYFVRGSWHYPQKHYEYEQTGVASWYGPRFHGQPKANGEIFNQEEVSAAHKTLPLPSVVKVTNLHNGASINLIVDDRGPYVYDREIDLSVGAAKRLGVYQKGLAPVKVETLVAESKALSDYLAKRNKRQDGRTWATVYRETIQGTSLSSPTVNSANVIRRKKMIMAKSNQRPGPMIRQPERPGRIRQPEDDLHRLISRYQ